MKRPSFQFYPGDWLQDASLRMVSIGARGLWIDMICLMHQGSEYGYLKVNGKVILTSNLSRMCGATLQEVEGWLEELSGAGVFSVDDDNCIFSRRMIRDEEVRKARASGGSKGGNPNLIGKKKVDVKVNLQPNLQPTPSSSSSSSSSSEEKAKVASSKPADDCPYEEIVALYHKNLPMLPSIKIWTDSRKRLLRARWSEDKSRQNLDWWERFFKYISGIPFLIGENDRGWQADIDHILTLGSFVKIIEGAREGARRSA